MTKRELIIAKALEKAPMVIGGQPDIKYMRAGYVMGATGWTCTQARLDAQARQYPGSADMIARYGKKWIGLPCYDCAQLNRTALAAAGYRLVSGATSQWKMNIWGIKGTIDQLPVDSRGLSLFTEDKVNGGMKHVAVCLGDGTEVEARGHAYGVVRRYLKDTSFTHWAMPIGLDDDAAVPEPVMPQPTPENPVTTLPTLRKGDKGTNVVTLQLLLLKHGMPLPRYGTDGDFGNETLVAVKQFQALFAGLKVDGICGPLTWAALLKEPDVDADPEIGPVLYMLKLVGVPESDVSSLLSKYPGSIKL